MRARNIKPGFYKNDKLVECSIAARLLAPGLWMLADKEGRLQDRPKQIKMEVFPADNIDVEQLLQELHTHKHILRYEIEGVKYIQILGFSDHQSPHYSEKDSLIPPPFRDDSEKKLSSSKQIPKPLQRITQPQPPDLLNPDSLNPESRKSRGSRLALTQLPDNWKSFCLQKRSDLDPETTFLKFFNHWTAKPGKDACKLDWFKTWQNWVMAENTAAIQRRNTAIVQQPKSNVITL